MSNLLSLGEFELILKKQSPYDFRTDGCIKWPPIFDLFFPPMFDLFARSNELVKNANVNQTPDSVKELGSRIENQLIPKLKQAKSVEEADTIVKEIFYEYPEMKMFVAEYSDKVKEALGSSSDPTLMMIPPVIAVIVVRAVAVYAIGYGIGYFFGGK